MNEGLARDPLGWRMKERYESRTRFLLPRRTYTLVRVDGKAFHSYTRGFKRPFDDDFSNCMDRTALSLVKGIQGAQCGFVQSDEISVLVTDFDKISTEAWFNGNVQKICSIAASLATMGFNREADALQLPSTATFDARVFVIPDREEVMNYFVWRQQDATRNSVQMLAQSLYSHSQLHGQNNAILQEMIYKAGQNWDDYPPRYKRGGAIIKEYSYRDTPNSWRWIVDADTPIFTKNRAYLSERIPVHGYGGSNDPAEAGTDNPDSGNNTEQSEVCS